jgi:hypothetical protein
LRLKRICNSENAFEEKLRELKGFLVKRGYNSDFVDDQFGRVREVDRNNLLMRKEGVKNINRNCFVIDYHPALRVSSDTPPPHLEYKGMPPMTSRCSESN